MKPTAIPLVDLSRQHASLMGELMSAINDVVNGSTFIGGKHVSGFETEFADFCGIKNCVSVANGTDALMLSLMALDIGMGDEVITTACSFFATAEAISRVGATPVFCDIDPKTANIDPRLIEKCITPSTRAVIPVHLYGQPADMRNILHVAKSNRLFVIEDCAQAAGARYAGSRIGTLGDVGCFSFYPTKNLGGWGDGGAIITNDSDLAVRCRELASHGGLQKYQHRVVGFNSRLDGIQAAVLRIKLRYLDEWNQQRQAIAAHYHRLLGNADVEHLQCIDDAEHIYHLYVLGISQRANILANLRQNGIGADIHYPDALPFVEAYKMFGYTPEDYPKAYRHAASALSLPIFPSMHEEEIHRVAECLLSSIKEWMGSTTEMNSVTNSAIR